MILTSTLFAMSLQASPCSCPEFFSDIPVMGHRGSGSSTSKNHYAENTLPSFKNAFAWGADYIELDIHLSSDRQVVVLHDFLLDDTTNVKGCVQDFTYAQLSTADATVGSDAESVVGIPLLEDALALAAKYKRKVNIEIKVDDVGKTCKATDINALVSEAIKVVQAAHAEDFVLFSSFSFSALEQVKKQLPAVPVGYLTAEGGERLLSEAERARTAGFEAINPIYFVLTEDQETFSKLDAMEIQIIPWTVNSEDAIRKLLLSGADAIITDDPALAIRVRDETPRACECSAPVNPTPDSGGCKTGNTNSLLPAILALMLLGVRRRLRSPRK